MRRTIEQVYAERGPMGFAPAYRDPPEEPPCPCEDGEPCAYHGVTDEDLARAAFLEEIAPDMAAAFRQKERPC